MGKAIRENLQFLILIGTLVAGTVTGVVKLVYGKNDETKKELRGDIVAVEDRVYSRLDRIEDKLDKALFGRGRSR